MKQNPVILAVDDQFKNIELLEAQLVPQGYEIVKAENGQEALQKLSRQVIDLVLLDVMMPVMSGLEVLEKVRADERTRHIPVVMVTGLKETEDKIKALEAGCDDFISKPFDKVDLLARVKSLLKISDLTRQLDENAKFKAVVDKITDGIVLCNADYLIKDSNAAILTYLNISDPKNVNLIEALFKNYSVPISKEEIMDPVAAHKKFDIVREATGTAEALYLEISLDRIKNRSGELLSIVIIMRDVTAARKEEALKKDSLELISHQLSAPLGVISGSLSLLMNGSYGPLHGEQQKVIEAVSKQALLIISIVEKRLGFTIVCSQRS